MKRVFHQLGSKSGSSDVKTTRIQVPLIYGILQSEGLPFLNANTMLISRILVSGRTTVPCLHKLYSQPLKLHTSRIINSISTHKFKEDQQKRYLHVSHMRRDMESAFRAIGSGVAVTGVIGPGIGIGIIFGNLVIAVARNPSMAGRMMNVAIMGAAFCEALGLLATLMSFLAFVM